MIRPDLVISPTLDAVQEIHYLAPTDQNIRDIAKEYDVDVDKLFAMLRPGLDRRTVFINMEAWRSAGNQAKPKHIHPILEIQSEFHGPITMVKTPDGNMELRMTFDPNKSRVIVVPRG